MKLNNAKIRYVIDQEHEALSLAFKAYDRYYEKEGLLMNEYKIIKIKLCVVAILITIGILVPYGGINFFLYPIAVLFLTIGVQF